MDISVIIVSWNVRDKLRENLKGLFKSAGVSFEVIVIDNNSSDESFEMLQAEFPEVKAVANESNFGFAKASNQGIVLSEGKYILLLNPDMQVNADSLVNAFNWLETNAQAAIAGVKLVDSSGEIVRQVRRFPGLFDQLMISLKLGHIFPVLLRGYLRPDFDYDKAAAVDSLRGAFFIIRRSTLEAIGALDERYFLWFEEVDYCRQAKAKGLEVWYTPAAAAIDHIGQSFNQLKRSTKQAYFRNSMIAYFDKWHPGLPALLIRLSWIGGSLINWIGDLIRLKPRIKT